MDSTDFTAEDLVMEPSFRKWVKREDPVAIAFWEKWLAQHPEKIHTVNEAKTLLRKLPDAHYRLAQHESQKMWSNITQNTQEASRPIVASISRLSSKKASMVFIQRWYRMAAVITLLLMAGITLLVWNDYTSHLTAYGETRQIILPDGSEVTLNAHSSLTYPPFWQWRKTREVWLVGEAFFEVRKAEEIGGKKFIVHTDQLNVEVLGTSFNVSNRRGKTQVVLNSGRVKLNTLQAEKSENVLMKPGDLVEFSGEERAFTKKVVNPNLYSAWKENKLLCDGTPMNEIAAAAEDRFGIKVIFEDPGLSEIEISGTLPLDNIDIFMELLRESTGVKITKNKDQMIIHKK